MIWCVLLPSACCLLNSPEANYIYMFVSLCLHYYFELPMTGAQIRHILCRSIQINVLVPKLFDSPIVEKLKTSLSRRYGIVNSFVNPTPGTLANSYIYFPIFLLMNQRLKLGRFLFSVDKRVFIKELKLQRVILLLAWAFLICQYKELCNFNGFGNIFP